MLAPPSEGENYFVGDLWHLQYRERRILAPSSEESAPCRKIPGATPAHGRKLAEDLNNDKRLISEDSVCWK